MTEFTAVYVEGDDPRFIIVFAEEFGIASQGESIEGARTMIADAVRIMVGLARRDVTERTMGHRVLLREIVNVNYGKTDA